MHKLAKLMIIAILSLFALPGYKALAEETPSSPFPGVEAQIAQPDPMFIRKIMDGYIERIKARIQTVWRPPRQQKTVFTVISFVISRDGSVSNLAISASCGDPQMDQIALKTIEQIAPFEPLPQELPARLQMDFKFDYFMVTKDELGIEQKQQLAHDKPEDAQAAFAYGQALHLAGQSDLAETEIKRAISLGYKDIEALVELAKAQWHLSKLTDAESTLRLAIAHEPNCAHAHKVLADLLFEQKRWDEAKGQYKELVRLEPNGRYFDLAQLRLEQCQSEETGLPAPEE